MIKKKKIFKSYEYYLNILLMSEYSQIEYILKNYYVSN